MSSALTIGRPNSLQREPWRLSSALVISAIIHAGLLSITLGGQTFGLPALKFPWQERRLGANDLQVLLLPPPPSSPAPVALTPTPLAALKENANPVLAPVERPAVVKPVATIPAPPPAIGNSEAPAILIPPPAPAQAPTSMPVTPAGKLPDIPSSAAPVAAPTSAPANATVRSIPIQEREAKVPDNASDAVPKVLEKEAQERTLELAKLEQEKQVAERLRQAELMADAQREATRKAQQLQEAARQEQERAEAARKEIIRQEQARQAQLEAARQAELRQEAIRAEQVARNEAARQEAERQALARQDEIRREQAKLEEKARQEAARQAQERAEIARIEAARKAEAQRAEQAKQAQLEAARQAQQLEMARQDAIKQEAARQEAAKQEAARLEQVKREQAQVEKAKQEAEREERLRAIGRQLNEEAAQRDAALKNPSRSLLPTVSGMRRGWLYGRVDPNADLVQYAEAISKKFELNMAFDMVREVAKQRHVPPMVTLAIRADGSVEKVTFVVSSGVPAIDEAIRNVVAKHAPYGAFPPNLARQYDVIEIRRTWIFDTAIRLQ